MRLYSAGADPRRALEVLPAIIRAQGEHASRRFIEFFTASIRNRNTRMAYARTVKLDGTTRPQGVRTERDAG